VSTTPIRLGVAGLGRAFMLMLPTLVRHPGVQLVACADPRESARQTFASDFGGAGYNSVEELCADPRVEAIYLATPHQFHVDHVRLAARAGKHVLVEKPMALTLADCEAMTAAADAGGVHLMVGHSHSYDTPYLRTAQLIASGEFGPVRMVNALNCTDYLYRPRRPEELITEEGGGAIFSQAPHQVEVTRLLAGSRIKTVRASAGIWDEARGTEGAYGAFLTFENGAAATIAYNGYGHFDTDALANWTGEMGQARDANAYGTSRAALKNVKTRAEEAALKEKRAYGVNLNAATVRATPVPAAYNHFGFFLVSCERGALRPQPDGVEVYGNESKRVEPLPPVSVPRAEVIDELAGALRDGKAPLHDGQWAMHTVQVCIALLESSRMQKEIAL
jgi:phthalate 4,5-cis-dihydrodiol dehydrogenase